MSTLVNRTEQLVAETRPVLDGAGSDMFASVGSWWLSVALHAAVVLALLALLYAVCRLVRKESTERTREVAETTLRIALFGVLVSGSLALWLQEPIWSLPELGTSTPRVDQPMGASAPGEFLAEERVVAGDIERVAFEWATDEPVLLNEELDAELRSIVEEAPVEFAATRADLDHRLPFEEQAPSDSTPGFAVAVKTLEIYGEAHQSTESDARSPLNQRPLPMGSRAQRTHDQRARVSALEARDKAPIEASPVPFRSQATTPATVGGADARTLEPQGNSESSAWWIRVALIAAWTLAVLGLLCAGWTALRWMAIPFALGPRARLARSSREFSALLRVVPDGDRPNVDRVRLSTSKHLHSPVAFGILRPEICLPRHLAARMPDDELEALLAHEWAHLRRRDPLWLAAAHLVRALWFWHAGIRWAVGRLAAIAEDRCDHFAVKQVGATSLARALVSVASHARHFEGRVRVPAPAMSSPTRSALTRRVESLLCQPTLPAPTAGRGQWSKLLPGLTLVCLLSAFPAIGLATDRAHASATTRAETDRHTEQLVEKIQVSHVTPPDRRNVLSALTALDEDVVGLEERFRMVLGDAGASPSAVPAPLYEELADRIECMQGLRRRLAALRAVWKVADPSFSYRPQGRGPHGQPTCDPQTVSTRTQTGETQ